MLGDEVTFDLSLFNCGNAMRCENAEQETAFLKYLGKKGIRRGTGEICSPYSDGKHREGVYYALKLEGLNYVLVYGISGVNTLERKILPYEYFVSKDKSASTEVAEDDPVEIFTSKEEHMVEFDLSKFTENLGIRCETAEQARTFFIWLKSINALRHDGELCEPTRNNYYVYKDRTAYFIELREDRKEVCYDSIDFSYKRHKPYEYFLKDTKTTNKTKKRKETMLEDTTAKVIRNAKKAAKLSKDTIITAQRGATVLAATKAGLNKGPLPEKMKELINTPVWGDFIAGIVLHTVVPTVTDSRKAEQAVEAANIVASVGLSGHYSWLQDMVKSIIESIPDIGAKAKEAVVETVEGLPS